VPPEQILDWTEEKFLLLLGKRNKRIERLTSKQTTEPAGVKMIQLGAKYLNDPIFVANATQAKSGVN
jgi:hypothetical protein